MEDGVNLNILMSALVIPGSSGGSLMLKAAFCCKPTGSQVIRMND
jgi:hypothetical protein